MPSLTMVQAATEKCDRMPLAAFRRELHRRGPFYSLMTRYALAHMGFVMQSTACNARHSVEQRLARWLLTAHDRVEADHFPLTQEFVAMMLGASRPTVTAVAGTLQRSGLITYHRGNSPHRRPPKARGGSCECYRVTVALLDDVTVAQPARTA